MSRLSQALIALMALALSLLAGMSTYNFVHFTQAPFVVLAAAVTNSPVPYGDDVEIKYTADRRALCKTDADTFMLREADQMVMYSERRPAGVTPLGTSSWVVRLSTLGLTAGKYTARIFVHSDCGDRLHSIEVPDLIFEVTG